jgi:flagellar M-ring protein FliF
MGPSGLPPQSQNSETRERVNYEISETEREVLRAPGAIKKLTVAVLVNGRLQTLDDGSQSMTPLPDDELGSLRELVASAVGFDEARGDVITIKSIPFEPIAEIGTLPPVGFLQNLSINLTSIIQAAVLALVALVLGLFVVRPILKSPDEVEPLERPSRAITSIPSEPTAGSPAPQTASGEIDDGSGEFVPLDAPVSGGETSLPAVSSETQPTDPVDRLRSMIGERKEETVEILRGWLDDKEETV